METGRLLRAVLAIATVAGAAVALAACGNEPATNDGEDNAGQEAAPASVFEGELPVFDGPYAAEFEDFYTRPTSDFVRSVLEDSQITDAEYAEMTSLLTSCLADGGITFYGFDEYGGFTTSLAPNADDTSAIVDQCSLASGENSIGALHSWINSNPENLDQATIQAACLVRNGVVPGDYGAEDFSQDNTGRFADFENLPLGLQEALVACSNDPLGLVE